jgi:hypothetical protein
MNFLKIVVTFLMLSFSMSSFSAQDYIEKYITPEHNQEFVTLMNDLAFNNDELDLDKLDRNIVKYNEIEKELYNSILLSEKYRYIERYNYTHSEALKKAEERIDKDKTLLFSLSQVINGLQNIKETHLELTKEEIKKKVAKLVFFLIPVQTFSHTSVYTDLNEMLLLIRKNFYRIPKDNEGLVASNIDTSKNSDLSLIDPSDSPFWKKTDIRSYNPMSEKFYGKKLFPESGNNTFYYKRMGRGSIKIKSFFYDNSGKKKKVTLKLGREVHPDLLSSHLARILGYKAKPMVFRKSITLKLGDTTYNQFLAQWALAHGDSGFHNVSGRIKSYDKDLNQVVLENVLLEAYPKNSLYKKIGPFKSARYGFDNRREYRALLLYASLINWSDSQERNIRVDSVRKSKSKSWKPIYYLNDTGMSMGDWHSVLNPGVVNTYRDDMVFKTNKNFILKYFQNGLHPNIWRDITRSDAEWIIRKMAQITPSQIKDITIASGLPVEVATLYQQRIARRINEEIP